jgi:predicted TIM-barrel fold metal-dependent hydrolase
MLLELLARDNWGVTVSNADRLSPQETGWHDAIPFARRLVEAAPDRAIWCTDWPHVKYAKPSVPNDADLLEFLYHVAPDPVQRRKILVDNPARLFGF